MDVRNHYADCTYRELYNLDSMPSDLLEAHIKLDKAVKEAYGIPLTATDKDCIIELYRQYRILTLQENE